MTDLFLRASSMPLAFTCPGSVRLPVVRLSEDSEPARMGSAGHEAFRPLVEVGSIDWDSISTIAARYDVDVDELRMLANMAARLWPALKPEFDGAMTELELTTTIGHAGRAVDVMAYLSGHLDAGKSNGRSFRVLDWKTGYRDRDYSQQMRAYAALTMLDDSTVDSVEMVVCWVRDGEVERYTMDRPALNEWLTNLRNTVIEWDGVYHPGAHCQHCPRSHECAAANALVRRDTAALLDAETAPDIDLMAPNDALQLYRRAKMLKAVAERVLDGVRYRAAEQGAIIGDDGRLVLESSSRREVEIAAAWQVLQAAGFVDEDFAAVTKMSITKIEDRVAKKAGRGKGAAAVRALNEALNAAGAITTTETQRLTEKR